MTRTMQAIVVRKPGGTEVLELLPDYPVPDRAAGQVLVKLSSASVNPADTAGRAGIIPPKVPKILGGDLAGVVEEVDDGSKFKTGDQVAALTPGFWNYEQEGTYAQYVSVDEDHLAKLPSGVDVSTAAGIPLAALTAWQALHEGGKLKAGNRCLVLAALGGVGHFAVQIAKAFGLYVVGVAGTRNVDWVKEHLGADEAVDYNTQDYAELYADNNFDVAVDVLKGQHDKILSVLKPDGHYAHIVNFGSDQDALINMQVFTLADVAAAHKQVESGHTRGKVVLAIPA